MNIIKLLFFAPLMRELRNDLGSFLALFSPRFRLVLANHAWFAASESKKSLRKPLQIILQFLLILFLPSLSALNIDVQADSAILMNADTGAILYEKNGGKQRFPASLTKIATALYTLKLRDNKLDKIIAAEHEAVASVSHNEMVSSNYTLPSYWLTHGASHIGIKRGEELSLKDLLYGMMIASGGDASNMLALYIGGTIPVFMDQLNAYFKEIGCSSTYFKNPHGLHHPSHVTTAYDMALLTKEAMRHPTFREIVRTVRYQRPETNKQKSTTLIQTNRLLKRGKHYYSRAIGVKTGYTSAAKHNLVAAAQEGGRTLIAVLMYCEDRDQMYRDAKRLFNTAFQEKKIEHQVLKAGPQTIIKRVKGAFASIKTCLHKDVVFHYYPSEDPGLRCVLKWEKLDLPIEKDQKVGALIFQNKHGSMLHVEPLFAQERVDVHLFLRIGKYFSLRNILKFFGACLAILFIGVVVCVLKTSSDSGRALQTAELKVLQGGQSRKSR